MGGTKHLLSGLSRMCLRERRPHRRPIRHLQGSRLPEGPPRNPTVQRRNTALSIPHQESRGVPSEAADRQRQHFHVTRVATRRLLPRQHGPTVAPQASLQGRHQLKLTGQCALRGAAQSTAARLLVCGASALQIRRHRSSQDKVHQISGT